MNFFMPTVPFVVLVFIFSSFFCGLIFYYLYKSSSKKELFFLLIAISVSCVLKGSLGFSDFNGLEYEDAYVYSGVASTYSSNFSFMMSQNEFQTEGCTAGSLVDCTVRSTYSGHLIGVPTIIYILRGLSGLTSNAGNVLSLIFSLLIVPAVFFLTKKISSSQYSPFVAVIFYVLTPIANLYASSTFSEIISSFYVVMCFAVFFNNSLWQKFNSILIPILFANLLLMTILVKRENITIIILFVFFVLIDFVLRKRTTKDFSKLVPCIFALIFYFGFFNIPFTVEAEAFDIKGADPFSVSHFIDLFPVLLKSLYCFEWFSVVPLFLIVGIWCGFISKEIRVLIFAILCYVLLYTLHYRSWGFVQGQRADPYEMLRYVMNYYPLICIVSAFGFIYTFSKIPSNPNQFSLRFMIITILVVFSVFSTVKLKQFYSTQEEQRLNKYISLITKNIDLRSSVLITSVPLISQIYLDPEFKIISFELLQAANYQRLLESGPKKSNVYFITSYDYFDLRTRYSDAAKFIEHKIVKLIDSNERYILFGLD